MSQIKTVTVRRLLREFKTFKDMLVQERVKTIIVPIGKDKKIQVSLLHEKNSASNIARKLASSSKKIKVKRSDIFEELI
ncbi:MAG TPA: hypothetical protein ENI23_10745 [bacterium]|nr:hypothetical protein [bacterium]